MSYQKYQPIEIEMPAAAGASSQGFDSERTSLQATSDAKGMPKQWRLIAAAAALTMVFGVGAIIANSDAPTNIPTEKAATDEIWGSNADEASPYGYYCCHWSSDFTNSSTACNTCLTTGKSPGGGWCDSSADQCSMCGGGTFCPIPPTQPPTPSPSADWGMDSTYSYSYSDSA